MVHKIKAGGDFLHRVAEAVENLSESAYEELTGVLDQGHHSTEQILEIR